MVESLAALPIFTADTLIWDEPMSPRKQVEQAPSIPVEQDGRPILGFLEEEIAKLQPSST